MKKYEIHPTEISEKAYDIYSDTSDEVFQQTNGLFSIYCNNNPCKGNLISSNQSLAEVEEYFEEQTIDASEVLEAMLDENLADVAEASFSESDLLLEKDLESTAEDYIDTYFPEKISTKKLIKETAILFCKALANDSRNCFYDVNLNAKQIDEINEYLAKNAARNIKQIISASRTVKDFSRQFEIPYRTAQAWNLGDREPSEWLVRLFDKLAPFEI